MSTPPPPTADGATVLVVDDDRPLLTMASEILRRAGYRVASAASMGEALAVARATPGLELLFTDVVMPGGSGLELTVALLAERPDVRVLVTTGQWDADTRRALSRTPHPVLRKPYTAPSLCDAVAALVGPPMGEAGP